MPSQNFCHARRLSCSSSLRYRVGWGPRERCQEGNRTGLSNAGLTVGVPSISGTSKHAFFAVLLLELGFEFRINDGVNLLAIFHIESAISPRSPQLVET